MINREDLKTVILICLVFLSMFFTSKIWFRLPFSWKNAGMPAHTADINTKVDILNIVSPSKIVVHFKGNQKTVVYPTRDFYGDLWKEGQLALRTFIENIKTSDPERFKDSSDTYVYDQPRIDYVFHLQLGIDFWQEALSQETYKGASKPVIKGVTLLAEKDSAIITDNKGKHYSIPMEGLNRRLEGLLNDLKKSNPPEYTRFSYSKTSIPINQDIYVPVNPMAIKGAVTNSEVIEPDKLARRFFSDMSVVRKIEEKDGATIYTDGISGLRIYPDGAVEYNHTITGKDTSENSIFRSLSTAVRFITQHGGWPMETYLDKINTVSIQDKRGYTFVFSSRLRGMPIVTDENVIEVSVSQGKVKNYFRSVVYPATANVLEEKMISAQEALEQVLINFNYLIGLENEQDKKIEDIFMAYYKTKEDQTLKPVWIVKISNFIVYVDAVTGEVTTGRN
ncbi:MAG: hypothetical protein PWQ82_287 [Thermosediminibacterales bacterium]|nr:hypothetical protein [Thermosediminibacterales bacterium]MDK2835818.1 hypothetical protein [Thermosediminibacterales bacterium]